MIKHARRLFLALGLAATTALGSVATPASAQIPYFQNLLSASQTKYAAIVVDAKSGEVLYAKHEDSPRYPASITKIMTLYLAFEALAAGKLHPEDRVLVAPHAAAQAPTKLGVRAGDSVSGEEAMDGMATKSANDMAVAMAEKLAGTESRLAALMTLRDQELGMQNTHFANASGLPDSRQLTTARDIAILSRAVMRDYPQYYKLFSLQEFTFRGQVMANHNHLLGRMPGVDGLKTGFTNASGFNLAVSAVRDNRRLIAVVMGGPTTAQRDQNAEDLLLTGFDPGLAGGQERERPAAPQGRPRRAGEGQVGRAGGRIPLADRRPPSDRLRREAFRRPLRWRHRRHRQAGPQVQGGVQRPQRDRRQGRLPGDEGQTPALHRARPRLIPPFGIYPFSRRSRAALSCVARPVVPPWSGWASCISRV